MVELQSFSATLVNASSALSTIEKQEAKGDSNVNHVIAEISAELQRERQKNAELLEKISFLEAQIQRRAKESLSTYEQGQLETSLKRFKRQKTEVLASGVTETETEDAIKSETDSEKYETKCLVLAKRSLNLEDRLVNWMSMDDDNQFLQCEKAKDGESTADCDDTDDSDDENDDYLHEEDMGVKNGRDHKCGVVEPSHKNQGTKEELIGDEIEVRDQNRTEVENVRNYKAVSESVLSLGKDTNCHTRSVNMSQSKSPPKVAFCPREVKRIIESEALQQGNAQSHTIRKIIIFASLGIRHGCEDMYELNFNHFSILRKGEPYESPTNPGEHVLYENPRYRRKVFYPNRQNPTLCPVQILEEEKAMRPSDSSCPSCLFLCIKYGGRTRNLPQNEYVRQRMGRNKLKSFGPLICRMAMLTNIRSGSFFFKALGITLLFMAGFPDHLVQRETKYRNLDLLQKYYRTDEEAEGEALFLQHPMTSDAASPSSQHWTGKTFPTKSKVKKQTNSNSNSNTKPHNNTQIRPSFVLQQPTAVHLNSGPHTQFGLMGFASIHTHAMATFQSIPSQPRMPLDNTISMPINSLIANSNTNANNVSYHNQITAPYHHMVPPQPANAFVPHAVMYWPHPNAYPQPHYASAYHGYRSLPYSESYISIHPQPYNQARHVSGSTLMSQELADGNGKYDVAVKEADSDDSDSSSSSTEPMMKD